MNADITVVVPTIPPRANLLARALASVEIQTLQPKAVIVETDTDRLGAALTRQRGLEKVETEWVAFLDDDDEFMAHHLRSLSLWAVFQRADYVFSWYHVCGGTDPRPEEFGLPWDRECPRQTTVTTLVRTEIALAVGGFSSDGEDNLHSPDRHYAGEDWLFTERVNASGATISHLPRKTWYWHHHGANTSGLPGKW